VAVEEWIIKGGGVGNGQEMTTPQQHTDVSRLIPTPSPDAYDSNKCAVADHHIIISQRCEPHVRTKAMAAVQ
jgi:hypothetical protein